MKKKKKIFAFKNIRKPQTCQIIGRINCYKYKRKKKMEGSLRNISVSVQENLIHEGSVHIVLGHDVDFVKQKTHIGYKTNDVEIASDYLVVG